MSEQVMIGLIGGGAAVFGAAIGSISGFIAANRVLDFNRQKENFIIRRDHLETSMKAWAEVRHAADSLGNDYLYEPAKDNKALLLRYVRHVTSICGCMAATPWIFSKKAREMELTLKGDLGLFNLALDLPAIRAYTLPDAITMKGLEGMLRRDAAKVMELLGTMQEHLAAMRTLAEEELQRLNDEYAGLIAFGIS
jgi:hypothetical protein